MPSLYACGSRVCTSEPRAQLSVSAETGAAAIKAATAAVASSEKRGRRPAGRNAGESFFTIQVLHWRGKAPQHVRAIRSASDGSGDAAPVENACCEYFCCRPDGVDIRPFVGRMLIGPEGPVADWLDTGDRIVGTVGHADGATQRSRLAETGTARGDDLYQLMIGRGVHRREMQIVQIPFHLDRIFTQPRIGGAEMGDEGFEIRTNIGT